MTEASPEVLVVGAGLVGLATAWQAAGDGMRVTVVADPARPPASRAAVGGLSFCPAESVLAGHTAIIELSAIARSEFASYVAAVERAGGLPTRYRLQPTLMTDACEADAALIDRVEAARAAVGFTSERLTGDECRALEPAIALDARAGLLLAEHDQIDSDAFVDSLRAACAAAGVRFIDDVVRSVASAGGRVTGVTTTSGASLESDAVVVAAGAWSSQIGGLPVELQQAVRPVSGQVVLASIPDGIEPPRHDLRSASAYMVFRSDRTVIVGATKVDRGFDETPTVAGVHTLLTAGASLWPPLLECEWLETRVGLRPRASDGLPIVGATSLEGLLVATAHFRNGVMFAAVSAAAVVAAIRGDDARVQFAALAPQREGVA